ncbi:MAG: YihY/virulence factor BrkB family protein [Candidatus Rokubacteria bacterium]|nr:YihY/virulence factor BrkB family protein [Candidatus Rokubacteria bacterium]
MLAATPCGEVTLDRLPARLLELAPGELLHRFLPDRLALRAPPGGAGRGRRLPLRRRDARRRFLAFRSRALGLGSPVFHGNDLTCFVAGERSWRVGYAQRVWVLPDVDVAWRDVWLGAALTSLLFTLGKVVIGLYLGRATIGSAYGAAGSLVVVLLWVYYSAQILFFGAEFTKVWTRVRGAGAVPTAAAVPLTEEARAERGMARGPKRGAP